MRLCAVGGMRQGQHDRQRRWSRNSHIPDGGESLNFSTDEQQANTTFILANISLIYINIINCPLFKNT